MKPFVPDGKILVQFDGMCILCSRTVRFIMKADKKKKFLFQTLQDSNGENSDDSVIVYDGLKTYNYFDAILKIGKELGGIYRPVAILRVLPLRWRHLLYLWIARNRYRWFGVRKSCFLPSAKDMERFI